MKNTVIALVLGAVFVILAFPVYSRRFQIEAKIWHWRHGYTATVGNYVVPVPPGWLIGFEDPDGRDVSMLDTHVKPEPDIPWTVKSMTVSYSPRLVNFESWEAITRRQLEKGAQREVEEFEVQAAEQRLVCLGGYGLRELVPHATLLSFECRSAGPLSLMYVGNRSGLEDFKAIASQIHRRN